jgi:hypothetical protein
MFVRSHYKLDWKMGEFVTEDNAVKDFEKYLVRISQVYIIALILLDNEAKWVHLNFLCLIDAELKASASAGPSS